MAGKRSKRERRRRVPVAPEVARPEVQSSYAASSPSGPRWGLGAVVVIGAAAGMILVGALYLTQDSRGSASEPAGLTNRPPEPPEAPIPGLGETTPTQPDPTGSPVDQLSAGETDPAPPARPDTPTEPAGSQPSELEARIQILQQQIRMRPDDGVNRALLASLLDMRGYLDEAEEHYKRAVKDAPNYARGRHDYGIFLAQRRGKLNQARRELEAAVGLEPNSAQIHVGLGFVQGESGDMASAMREFNRALELDPSHIEAHFYLANALDEVGRLEESAEQYRTVSRLQPGYYAAHYGLGVVLAKQGDFAAAEKQFRTAMISPSAELRNLAEKAVGYLEEERQAREQGAPSGGEVPPGFPTALPPGFEDEPAR